MKTTLADFSADNPFQLAAALSYFTLLSMVPLFLLLTGVAGLVFGREAARDSLLAQVRQMVGPQEAEVVRALLAQAGNHHASAASAVIGTIVMVVGATTVFAHLQAALNQIWDVRAVPRRSVFWRLLGARLLALAIVLGMVFILLVFMAASAALAGAHGYLEGRFPGAGTSLRAAYALFSFAVISGMLGLLFKYVPDVLIRWRDVLFGALLTGALFTIGKYALGLYLAHLRYGSAGAAGSLIVIVVWVYYSALILFLGAEITQVYARQTGTPIIPSAHAERVGRRA